jgi:hypothetical protein
MRRFGTADRVRAPAIANVAGRKDEEISGPAAASSYRRFAPTLGYVEMAERVVSDVIVAECSRRCGSPWRGCGIPAEDPCLLAIRAASRQPGLAVTPRGGLHFSLRWRVPPNTDTPAT